MKALLHRVQRASVTVENQTVASIGSGLLILLGIGPNDTRDGAVALAKKSCSLRIFSDENGKMNLSVVDMGGEVIVVSQFTLYADTRKGLRPSFTDAAPPEQAQPLVDFFVDQVRTMGVNTQQGVFGADMKVELVNDGPVTILLEN
jgi:D-aminoacyl-tRNA deacylase